MANLKIYARIGGVDYGDVGTGDDVGKTFVSNLTFGARDASDSHFDIRNINVGTTAYGSSDVFAPVLDDLSEFDGVFDGTGGAGTISAAAGVLTVDSPGNIYAYKLLGADYGHLFVSFELRVRSGDIDPDYHNIGTDDPSTGFGEGDSGIFLNGPDGAAPWFFDSSGTGPGFGAGFGAGAPVDSFILVELLWSYDGTTPTPTLSADFTGTPTSGVAPLTVVFTDASTPGPSGPITAWLWDFGDGHTSTSENPTHIYTTAGTYTVSLQVTGTSPDGTDTRTRTDYITVNAIGPGTGPGDATPLTPFCAEAVIHNADQPNMVSDPLVTVYGYAPGEIHRQCWFKLTNTAAVKKYARFTFTNDNASAQTEDFEIAGTPYGPFIDGFEHATRKLYVGARETPVLNDLSIRNIKVGTAGFGSSDIWAPALGSTADFDSIVGGVGLTVAGGVLNVTNGGSDAYGIKDLGADHSEIFIQFDVKFTAAQLAAGTTAEVFAVANPSVTASWSGLYWDSTGGGWTVDDNAFPAFGLDNPPPADTWVTVGMHYNFTGTSEVRQDVAAGLFSGYPGPLTEPTGESEDGTSFEDELFPGGTGVIGALLDPGETIWVEVAGWDRFGHGWNNGLLFEWQLLDATFYDEIATNTPPIVGVVPGATASNDFPFSYVHHAGAHWLAESLFTTGTMGSFPGHVGSTFPGGTDYPGIVVKSISDDGLTINEYIVNLDYAFAWDFNISGTFVDLCTFNVTPRRTEWFAGMVMDMQLASDGENLWLGVVCIEERPYPFYQQRFDVGYLDADTLEALGLAAGYHFYSGSFFCSGDSVHAFDDLGPGTSQRWESAHLVMFVFDGGGFTRIDEVDAKFVNWNQDMTSTSGISVAASPAEPGVCHAMWSEAGVWGIRAPGPGEWPNRGSRLNYTQWSAGAKILDVDQLYYDQAIDLVPYPPPVQPHAMQQVGRVQPPYPAAPLAQDNYGSGITPATYMYTPNFLLKNDHGWPVCFVNRVDFYIDVADNNVSELDKSEATLRMWDMRGAVMNAPNEIQTITPDLLPTTDETKYLPPGPPTNVGYVPDRTLSSVGTGDQFFSFTRSSVRSFHASPAYADPLIGGTPVYLLLVPWNVSFLEPGQPNTAGFYRVPCDGSGPFTPLDGDRALAILPNSTQPGNIRVPFVDFFSEPRNVWMIQPGGGGSPITQLDRLCNHAWISAGDGSPGPPDEFIVQGLSTSAPYYIPNQDVFYMGGLWSSDSGSTANFGVLQPLICRNCLICALGECAVASEGFNVWDRIAWVRRS